MPNVGKLIPIAEYKKPLLQLNGVDQYKINLIKSKIVRKQRNLTTIETELSTPWFSEEYKLALRGKIDKITKEIAELHKKIRDIKIERHNQQKLNVTV